MGKRYVFILCIIIIIFSLNVSHVIANPNLNRAIRIGGDNHLPPYQYINDNGIYKGFSVDIMNAIAIEMGLDIELHPMPWYLITSSMHKGEIDAILGMTRPDYYKNKYLFSNPYITMSSGIFARYDNKHVVDLEDLSSVRVAVQKDNCPQEILKYVDQKALTYVDNQQQGILLLMMGKVDAFVGDRLVGMYTIQKWKQTNFIKIVGEPIAVTEYCFVTNKENTQLIHLLNTGLEKIRDNGTYEKIYNKWFGEIIRTPEEIRKEIFNKVLIVLGAAAAVFIIIIRLNQLLKREIRKRTRELAEANKQLIENNEKIRKEYLYKKQVLDSIYSGLLTLEQDGLINFCNTNARKFLQEINCEEIVGKNIYETSMDKLINFKHVEGALVNGAAYIDREKEITVNQEERVIRYYVYPLKGTREEPSGAIISFRDVTNEKRMQKSLIQKDKMSALGQLVATIAHEIRNPLMAIKTFTDILPDKIDNERFRERFLKYVPRELERIQCLVVDLLEYARPRKAVKEQFQLKELINEIITLFRNKFREHSVELIIAIPDGVNICADRQQIKQVLINLILNSMEATKANGTINISAQVQREKCVITISDNGEGIPKHFIHQVMNPFFTLKRNGTGLGLSICYELVKENGGEIHITSSEKKGTTIDITLPMPKGGTCVGKNTGY